MNAPDELKLLPAPAKTPAANFLEQWTSYWLDTMQRSVLFLDVLRERANNMLEHERNGLPPLLDFEYETILDARRFEHPANYALLRITGSGKDRIEQCLDESKPPVIIVDPRAGHGPGIGGFKRDSEVGIALHEGHAVYFVIFFPEPCPAQTLADVLHALRRFVEEVGRRHPGKPPVLYGNCQAGWAVMLLAADCEGLAGPTVLNGSPLSYWAGASDANPMRLAGGLTGGAWIAHYLADLGNGRFDGAWLAQNFENLNPANTLWDKNYKLFANVDTERERFLEFERWWTGFYSLSREEFTAIVENLFIGNKLWLGTGAAVANVVYAFAFNAVVLPDAGDWWRLVAMAVFSAGAFAAMLAGLQLVGAVRNAIIGVMEPLTVAVLAFIFLDEPVTLAVVVGGVLILGGAVLAMLIRTTKTAEPPV